jgi:hypothetical protein
MANTRVVVIAKDVEQAKARFGDSVGVVAAPLTGESLIAAVNTALEGVSSPANVRAEGYATQASAALLAMAQAKGPITSAVAGLAQQLGRSDGIAVPAAKALGHSAGASELGALLAALAGGGSIDLKKACAEAVGNIVGRVGSCPDEVAVGLMEAMAATTDIGLRTSIAVALGKANLDGQRKADLLKKLNRIASAPAAGEG